MGRRLVNIFIFMVIWVLAGDALVFFFFPDLLQNEATKQAVPWVMMIGYIVATIGTLVADFITKLGHFEDERS